ncbi:MAG: hypothetical protein QM650_10575 [Microlunatus sp.]
MTTGCIVALVCIGLAVLIGIGIGIALVACLVRDYRERQDRIARQQIVATAEQELRDATRATMQAMREAVRDRLRG